MKTLYHVNFIFAYEIKDEDDCPSEDYIIDMTKQYLEFDNIPTPKVIEIPNGFRKNYLPYGGKDNESISDILLGPNVIIVNGFKYRRIG